jgi:hypothetical protein
METVHERYLALCGVIFIEEDYLKFRVEWETMKRSLFDGDPDEPIILHRKELCRKAGFSRCWKTIRNVLSLTPRS